MRINENIRTMRKRKSLSQSETATNIGISKLAYGRIERGESSVTFERIQELCVVFGCTVNELINISTVDAQHVVGTQNLQSDFDNLIVMSDLQHQYSEMGNLLYKLHKEHATHEILGNLKSQLETFIDHSHYSVADGFVDDFFNYVKLIQDGKEMLD